MGMNIQEAAINALLHARELAKLHPESAKKLSLNAETFALAEEWYANPENSQYENHAANVSEIIQWHSTLAEKDTYTNVFYTIGRYGTFPTEQTRWHKSAMFAAQNSPLGNFRYSPEEAAVEYTAFLQRASLELLYLGTMPTDPFYSAATSLIQRLWSAERGDDKLLPAAVGDWFKYFVSQTLTPK